MGNNSKVQMKGKGSINLKHGKFKDVIYVPSLATNMLYIYHMTHTGSPKRAIFCHDLVEMTYISSGNIIAKGDENHSSRAYEFSHFMPFSEPVHSQEPLSRESKNISSTSFAYPAISVYEVEIQGDSNPYPVPTSKLEARKMIGNPSDT